MLVEKSIQIKGKKQLTGEVEISGAKNAVLKQMILPILCEGKYKIENVPNIADVFYMQDVPVSYTHLTLPTMMSV